jgi:hypothetical protein
MTTLISWGNSSGELGRCDAKCYDAIGGNCRCICGGLNHGVGKDKAIENTREHIDDWLYAIECNLSHDEGSYANVDYNVIYQLKLPI